MLIVVLEGNGGVDDGENLETVEAGFGALGGIRVEWLGGIEGAV